MVPSFILASGLKPYSPNCWEGELCWVPLQEVSLAKENYPTQVHVPSPGAAHIQWLESIGYEASPPPPAPDLQLLDRTILMCHSSSEVLTGLARAFVANSRQSDFSYFPILLSSSLLNVLSSSPSKSHTCQSLSLGQFQPDLVQGDEKKKIPVNGDCKS